MGSGRRRTFAPSDRRGEPGVALRIIAGTHGGRRIEAPPGGGTRPTSERVREAWFAAMAPGLPGARVLDLFAGSGALGIEALSRGAARAHFVEADPRALAVLRRNLASLGLEPRALVIRADVFRWLSRPGRGETAHIALADPPYGTADAVRLARRFLEGPFAGCLWIEHEWAAREALPDGADWSRRYGDTGVCRYPAPEPEPRPRPEGA